MPRSSSFRLLDAGTTLVPHSHGSVWTRLLEMLPHNLRFVLLRTFSLFGQTSAATGVSIALFTFALDIARRMWMRMDLVSSVIGACVVKSRHINSDDSYKWLMEYWTNHGWQANTRDFTFIASTATGKNKRFRYDPYEGVRFSVTDPSNKEQLQTITFNSSSKPYQQLHLAGRIKPRSQTAYWFWKHGTLFKFDLSESKQTYTEDGYNVTQSELRVLVMGRSKRPLFNLIKEAKEAYLESRPSTIAIRTLDNGQFSKLQYSPSRSFETIILDPSEKASLIADVRAFLNSRAWYSSKQIPYRRGYMLKGVPGAGKSSTIKAVASEFSLDIYQISLSSEGITDTTLAHSMRNIPEGAILVLEDIDAAFSGKKRTGGKTGRKQQMHMMGWPDSIGALTLSGLLNAIDGIGSGEGRLLFMTTNHPELLDPALVRPGRVDFVVEYKNATRYAASQLFKRFYPIFEAHEPINSTEKEMIAAGVIKTENKNSVDEMFLLPKEIDQAMIDRWADDWVASIDDYVFSIAELQGMLLNYKVNPKEASEAMEGWVQNQLETREKQRVARDEAMASAAIEDAKAAAMAKAAVQDPMSMDPMMNKVAWNNFAKNNSPAALEELLSGKSHKKSGINGILPVENGVTTLEPVQNGIPTVESGIPVEESAQSSVNNTAEAVEEATQGEGKKESN